ncbi:hypothetical protein AURDEDRAFT_174345 [Auricularia subglabra TFB-10046 SS5]|nr:hypothetical protein AURDEDRAFT_174345 [Auricularia subglabra TFB-10046 SS5]
MPATPAQVVTNLLTELSHILGNVLSALSGVAQAFTQLFSVVVASVIALGRALSTAAFDLFQTTIGLIWANLFLIVVAVTGYYFWSQRQPRSSAERTKRRKWLI